jgi:hypothetical protein
LKDIAKEKIQESNPEPQVTEIQSFKRPQEGMAEQEKTLNALTKELFNDSSLFVSRKKRKQMKK